MARTPRGTTLGQLILDRKGDRSFAQLADDCGGIPAGRRLQQMATKPIKNFPDPETITHLSKGLGTTAGEVVAAAARSLGIRVSEDDPASLTIPGAGQLPGMAREALLYMGRAMVAMQFAGGDSITGLTPRRHEATAGMAQEHFELAAFIPEPDDEDGGN